MKRSQRSKKLAKKRRQARRILVGELGISQLAQKGLESKGIVTVGDLVKKTASELLEIPYFWEDELRKAGRGLAAHGLRIKGYSCYR